MPYLLKEYFYPNDMRDLSNWILVGEVENPIYPEKEGSTSYIFVNPDIDSYDGPDWRFKNDCVRISSKPDGTGIQGYYSDIMSFYRRYMRIYPEHLNDKYGDVILGKGKSPEVLKAEHDAFLRKLNLRGNDVVLKHNSSVVIKDGVIKKGTTNHYSNNSDDGIYFWGSKDVAADPSNEGMYTYFCHIPLSELYDLDTNRERLTLKQAISRHSYVGKTWNQNNPNVIVVNTYRKTPIDYILEKRTGKYYNAQWEEIEINENKSNNKMLIEGKIRKIIRESVKNILSEELYIGSSGIEIG